MKDLIRFAIVFFVVIRGHAQDISSISFPQIVPPSPEAAALGKYGEIPVGMYTGIPEIGIPLYQIQSSRLSLPISLSYHAGGIKVEDIASNIGLGWSLNAGGVITRTIVGRPDNAYNGFFTNTLPENMMNISNDDLQWIAENRLDSQPDEYYFNFGNYSGKLVFKKDGTCITIPHYKFKIKPAVGPLNGDTNLWEITTEDGTIYTFAATETSTTQSVCTASGGIPMSSYEQLSYVSSWYLTKIQSPHAAEFITLDYWNANYDYDPKGGSTYYYKYAGHMSGMANYSSLCDTHISLNSKRISQIQFPGGKIVFEVGSRSDLIGAVRITSMTVLDYQDQLIKKYSFDNDQYFESGCGTPLCKRLKLDAVVEIGKNNAQLPPYLFQYNSEVLPPRNSYDTDYWGYYNKKGNTYGFPELIDYANQYSIDYLPGDVKKPNANASKAGILTKIIYPTGGYTSFEYELNEVISDKLPNKTSEKIVKRIDGSASNPNKESTPFTIQGYSQVTMQGYSQAGLFVVVRYQTTGCSTSSIPSLESNCPVTEIVGVNGTTYQSVFQSGLMKQTRFFLPNGQYKLKGSHALSGQSYFIEIEIEPEVNSPNKFAGGLRVAKISDFNGISPTGINIRKFVYNDEAGASTGRITNLPVYRYIYSRSITESLTMGVCLTTSWLVRTQESNSTLGTTRSSYVGYGRVVELQGEYGENGKIEYHYSSVYKSQLDGNNEFIDFSIAEPPFGPPTEDKDWKRGNLMNKIVYKYQPGSFIKVHETINSFQVLGSENVVTGLKSFMMQNDNACASGDQRQFAVHRYYMKGNLSYVPIYTIERSYNADGLTFSETRTDFTFNTISRQLVESVETFDNSLEKLWKRTTKFKYPSDYSLSAAPAYNMALALSNMVNVKHIHNALIEKQVWENRNGVSQLIDAEINLFKANGYQLDKQLKLQSSTPLSSYVPSYLDASNNFVYENSKFREQLSFVSYDATSGNLLEAVGDDGIKRSFLWGYEKLYPITEAFNAGYTDICYTSFEEPSVGWVITSGSQPLTDDGITGSKYFAGSLETNAPLAAGNYKVTFWAKGIGGVSINGTTISVNNSGWGLYEHLVTLGSAKIYVNSNGLRIDELRAYPATAQMKTFTYSPLVGQTSVADFASIPITYQYDDFNRLKSISDAKGNILKTNAYNIKGYSGPPPPSSLIALFTTSGVKKTDETITFTALNSASGVQYSWDFGDGTQINNGSQVVTHTYSAPGFYVVNLIVSKGIDTNYHQETLEIKVPLVSDPNWPGPTISVTGLQSALFPPPGYVTINVTATPVSGGTAPYKEYRWEVYNGQGNKIVPNLVGVPSEHVTTSPTATLSSSQHSFGPYTIKCRVVGDNDVVSQQSVYVTGQ